MPDTATKVRPFGVVIDQQRNQDVMLQCIPGQRLRTALDPARTVMNSNGEETIPEDQARHLGKIGRVEGMQLHVNPDKLTYKVIDPLHDDEEKCSRLKKHLDSVAAFRTADKLDGVPPLSGKLDVHRMKSLCRELIWLVDAKDAKCIKGTMPEMVDVEEMPGNFLLNPGSNIPNGQPKYEKDYDEWCANLSRSGG